eukprot:s2541_g6.t1
MEPPEAEDAEEGGESEDEKPLRIFTATCVSGKNIKGVWMPETQIVGGYTFIKLHKWCRELTQFVTGRALQAHCNSRRPLHNINVQWFVTMEELRKQACDDALKRVIVQAAEAEGSEIPKNIRPARQEDEFIAGRSVLVTAPAIEGSDDDPPQIRLLWTLKTADIWMELTTDNMEYMKKAIRESPPWQQPVSKRAKAQNVSPKKRRKRGPKPKRKPVQDDGEASENAENQEDDADKALQE